MESSLEQIKLLNLTENDFKLLVDGLDVLPEKGMAGELMGDLFMGIMTDKKDSEAIEKIKLDRENKRRIAEKAKESLKDDIKILQGKLLMLKRYLQENKLLKDTYEILNIPQQ